MQSIVNHLIQLQELTLIRDEQKVVSKGEHLEQLNDSIASMTKELPKDIRIQYESLNKKDPIAIVPISGGSCPVCGMSIPISQAQAVRMAKKIFTCPQCARILFEPESRVMRKAERIRRTAPRKVGISRFSSHTLMIPKLASTDKDGVIEELALKMEHEGFVDNGAMLIEEALRREAILPTGVDHGLAFPHVRHVEGGGLTLALGVAPKGIKFGGPGKLLTKIIIFMVIPTAASAFYLKLLAGLTESFRKPESRKAVMDCKDDVALWKALCKVTRTTVK